MYSTAVQNVLNRWYGVNILASVEVCNSSDDKHHSGLFLVSFRVFFSHFDHSYPITKRHIFKMCFHYVPNDLSNDTEMIQSEYFGLRSYIQQF